MAPASMVDLPLHLGHDTRARSLSSFITLEFHAVYFAFVTLLIDLMQLMYQTGGDSPFKTHPKSMGLFVTSISIYGLASLFQLALSTSNCSKIFGHIIMISGVLSPISLVSVFVPNWLGWLLYFMWLIFSIMVVAWDSLLLFSQWLCQRIRIALLNTFTSFCQSRRLLGQGQGQRQGLGLGLTSRLRRIDV